jgi:hypothetical protein
VNVITTVRAKSSNRRVLNGTASIIAMKPAPAATQAGRGVVTKGVTVKETLNGIRVWRLLTSQEDICGLRILRQLCGDTHTEGECRQEP